MALRKKFRSLLPKSKQRSSQEDEDISQHLEPVYKYKVIASIEQIYFSDDSFDSSKYELEKLSAEWDPDKVDEKRDTLRRQLQSVSKKVSDLVLENHSAYVKELQRVMELKKSLQTANVICANGRRQLSQAKTDFTVASLSILAKHRKRLQLISLMRSLHTIKTLQRTDIRLREMMEEEDYPGAIQLCLECQKAASTFKHFTCISELNSKLQDTLEMIEEQLDHALCKTCSNFDTHHYDKVQTAYRLLGKTQTAMDQLHMHFTSAIHNTAFTMVLGYIELCSGNEGINFQKMPYRDLCGNVTVEMYIPCLVDLCKALWEVMKSYHKTIEWHEKFDPATQPVNASETGRVRANVEANLNRMYIKKKLEHGLTRIWQDVQQKVKTYLLGTDLAYFKFDDFLNVLNLINRLMEIGEEFCGSKSEGLQDSIRQQSANYFKNYHRARMDELRMFLENEAWELCPVRSSFSILNLQEFKSLKKSAIQVDVTKEETNSPLDSPKHQNQELGYFVKYGTHGNPFEVQIEEEEGEDVMAANGYESDDAIQDDENDNEDDSDDSDVPEELKLEYVDEQTGEQPTNKFTTRSRKKSDKPYTKSPPPIVTNTTLNVLRFFGKYMQMMRVLKSIAFDVTICMSQLFDYYLFAVYSFFVSNSNDNSTRVLGSRLTTSLKRIQDNLIQQTAIPGMPSPTTPEDKIKLPYPHLSPVVDMTDLNRLFGLSERIVATESLLFLAQQFQFLQPHLEAMIPASKKPFLQQFYSQTIMVASELRTPVYRSVATKAIDFEDMIQMMANVKWDIKEIMSQHSAYVDWLLEELQVFDLRVQDVARRVPLPQPVYYILWEHIIRLCNWTFVEGFATAKKCSNEGRALMQLDFQQFLMKLEKLTDIRPIPDREYVETYIKAFYLAEDDMEQWIRDHREYSSKQLTNLVLSGVGSLFQKKSRQKLVQVIEEIDKLRR
ncbi:syndetin-like [Ptychodera flava]|uniref:syndetin-like n=1 Tax=Ptychodera flava TaxID=63121 RepID=UPI003969D8D9